MLDIAQHSVYCDGSFDPVIPYRQNLPSLDDFDDDEIVDYLQQRGYEITNL